MRDLKTLPKAHLHIHLDGAIREATLRELCARRGTAPPAIPPGNTFAPFDVFMDTITACHDVLASPDNLERIVGEVVEDAAADGAVWVELSLWPGMFRGQLGPERDAVLFVLETGLAAAARVGISFGLMIAANRHAGPRAGIATAELAVDLGGGGVVSFGLDGDEASFPSAPFVDAFAIAKRAGLLSTPHAGELLGPQSVGDAIDVLHADRILHGVRAAEDARLLARLAGSSVCLDVCPTSNFGLGVCDPEAHPLPVLLDAGVRCSVNADDPLLFGSSLLGEYELCRSLFSMSDHQLAQIAANSIHSSGASRELKATAAAGIARWLEDAPSTPPG